MSPTWFDKATDAAARHFGEDARTDRIPPTKPRIAALDTSVLGESFVQRTGISQPSGDFDLAVDPDTSPGIPEKARRKSLLRSTTGRGPFRQLREPPLPPEDRAVRDAVERERRRIARDIHDHVEQWLAVAGMRLALAERSTAEAGPNLAEVRKCLGELDAGLRTITQELRTPLLPAVLLPHRLRELAEGWSADFGIPVCLDLDAAELTDPPCSVAETLSRVARTMLNNVAKHAAAATRVDLRLAVRGGRVWLSVADDGPGFDTAATRAAAGTSRARLGLTAMRERLAELGGDLLVASEPGRGTVVTAVVPLGGRNAGTRTGRTAR